MRIHTTRFLQIALVATFAVTSVTSVGFFIDRVERAMDRQAATVLGGDLDAIEWTEIQPGIATHSIELSEHAKGDLRLLRLDPGKRLPSHGHHGEELSLVLHGSYSDESGSFGVGDMSDLDDDTLHSVLAGPEGCIILIACEKKPEFLSELAQASA